MRNIFFLIPIFIELLFPSYLYAYPLQINRFENEGSLYVESSSIVNHGRYATLSYVENFSQPRSYGELTYLSKATDIRIDCPSRRVFSLTQYFYSKPDRSGRLLGMFPLDDEFGSYAEHGSWVSEVVRVGCGSS